MVVPAFGVVNHFDVIKDVLTGLLSSCVNLSLDPFALELLD